MHIEEVTSGKSKKRNLDKKTDFEKNATRLRRKERELDARKPIKPVSTS